MKTFIFNLSGANMTPYHLGMMIGLVCGFAIGSGLCIVVLRR